MIPVVDALRLTKSIDSTTAGLMKAAQDRHMRSPVEDSRMKQVRAWRRGVTVDGGAPFSGNNTCQVSARQASGIIVALWSVPAARASAWSRKTQMPKS